MFQSQNIYREFSFDTQVLQPFNGLNEFNEKVLNHIMCGESAA